MNFDLKKFPINNIPALLQKMAWLQWGDKALFEPKFGQFTDTYIRHLSLMS